MIRILEYGKLPNSEIFARVIPQANVSDAVEEIIRRVCQEGDAALLDYTRRFDGAELTCLAVTEAEIQAAFDAVEPEFLEGGVCVLLASGLSGTYQSACMARDMVGYDKVYIIDALSATYTIKLMADHAAALRSQGMSAPDIVAQVEALKGRCKVIAVPDTLEFLCKGGRVSRTSATIGTLANIKPIIVVTPDGKIGVPNKCIGMGKAQAYLLKYLQDHPVDEAFPLYSIYSYGTDNCAKMEEKLAAAQITVAQRLQIGPTIGTHIGPNALGIVYVQK